MRRLALNGRFLVRPVTGVERVALELTRAVRVLLREAGRPDIEVLLPSPADVAPEQVAAFGAPAPTFVPVGRSQGHRWEQFELPGAQPDAWLLNLCNTGPAMRRRQAIVIHDAQFVLHPQSYSRPFRWWYRVLLTIVGRQARAVFTVSESSKTALERYGIVPRGKAHVLRLGVDHLASLPLDDGVLARHGLAPGEYILAIGSLAPHKNLSVLIDAFLEADLPGVRLVVAGGGYARVFQEAGLRQAPNIHYTGRVTDEELKALYAHALAFACPSLSEGFGLTPLEAMSMGCPVVATTGGAVPEVCGDAALYADPRDRAAWRDALRSIVADAALRTRLSACAIERASGFVWRDTARQMLAVLAGADQDQAGAGAGG